MESFGIITVLPSIHHVVTNLELKLSLFYLDDNTVDGETDCVTRRWWNMKKLIGLHLNM